MFFVIFHSSFAQKNDILQRIENVGGLHGRDNCSSLSTVWLRTWIAALLSSPLHKRIKTDFVYRIPNLPLPALTSARERNQQQGGQLNEKRS